MKDMNILEYVDMMMAEGYSEEDALICWDCLQGNPIEDDDYYDDRFEYGYYA